MEMQKDDCWAQVRTAVRAYPARKKQKQLPPQKQREVEAVEQAIQWAAERYGKPVADFIQLYHIRQSHTLEEAAAAVGYSRSRMADYNLLFMRHLAALLGYRADDES
jgi:hypothetical protein